MMSVDIYTNRRSKYMPNPEEQLRLKCPDCGATAQGGKWSEVDESRDWGTLGTGPRWHCAVCDCYRVIVPFAVDDHLPTHGSEVERWLEGVRDQHAVGDSAYSTLNALLENYRDMASEGISLAEARETGQH